MARWAMATTTISDPYPLHMGSRQFVRPKFFQLIESTDFQSFLSYLRGGADLRGMLHSYLFRTYP
jgi:hypothetical protein